MDQESVLVPIQCTNCKKVYSDRTRDSFEAHIKTCGKGQYQCDVCQKTYFSQLTLKNHLKTHWIGTGFKCLTCGKEFKTKFKLTLHMKTHNDKSERDRERLKCEYCDKSFAWSSSLGRHRQVHFNAGAIKYFCKCGKHFSRYTQLYFHKKTCAVEQQDGKKERKEVLLTVGLDLHRCQLCNQGFKERDGLDKHVVSCDPLSTEIRSQHGDALSKDEQEDIKQVIADKMAKLVCNAKTSMAKGTDGMPLLAPQLDDNDKGQEIKKGTKVKGVEINENMKKSHGEENNSIKLDVQKTKSVGKSMKLSGNKDRKMGVKTKGKSGKSATKKKAAMINAATVVDQQASIQKKGKKLLQTRQNKKLKLETVENEISKNVSDVKDMTKKPSEIFSPRRTQRVRKKKQYPGYQVDGACLETEVDEPKEVIQNVDQEQESSKKQEKDVVRLKVIKNEVKLVPVQSLHNLAHISANEISSQPSKLDETPEISPVKTCTVKSKLKNKIERRMEGVFLKEDTADTMDVIHPRRRKKYTLAYTCKTGSCNSTFHALKDLASHKKQTHKELFKHLCSNCNKEFCSFVVYKSHIRMEHSSENALTYLLKNVEIAVMDKNGLTDGKISICCQCGYRYNKNLEDSKHDCEPVKLRYYCPCCKYNTEQSDQIMDHITSSHKGKYHAVKNKHQYLGLRSKAKEPGCDVIQEDTVCEFCQVQMGSNQELRQHLNEKHALHPFVCGLCKSCYGRKNALQRHLLTHVKSAFSCSRCHKEFYEKARLEAHMLTHTGDRPFQCEVCGNRYCDEKAVKKHLKLKHIDHYKAAFPDSIVSQPVTKNSTAAVCHFCGMTFRSEAHLKRHMRDHGDSFVYKCQHCDQTFNERVAYKKHKSTHITFDFSKHEEVSVTGMKSKDVFRDIKAFEERHPSGLPFRCKVCDKRFGQVKSANLHIRTVHMREKDKKYVCLICKRGFPIRSALHNHMRTHTNSKPYRCRVCNKCYRQVAHIRQHLLHHGKAMFKCQICGNDFKVRGNLRAHVKTHCRILPFKCPVSGCKAAFQCLYVFLKHYTTCIESVAVDTALQCNFCDQSFLKEELNLHYYEHENEDHFACEICRVAFKNYPDLYFHKERKGHFVEADQGDCKKNSLLFTNRQKLKESTEDWSMENLMSQYDYIQQDDEHSHWVKPSEEDSTIYLEQCKDMDTNEGELILIAEQLTHMASGAPFREVIVKAAEGTEENLTEIAIDDLEQGVQDFTQINEVTAESTRDTGCNVDNDTNVEESAEKIAETDNVTYQFIVDGDHISEVTAVGEVGNDEGNKDTVDYTIQTDTNETTTNQAVVVNEENVPQVDGYAEVVEVEGSKMEQTIITESSVEVIADSCDLVQHNKLESDSDKTPVKFVDQTGNEIIVYVLNEHGEQIQVTDSKDILRSILQNISSDVIEDSRPKTENIELQVEEDKTETVIENSTMNTVDKSEEFALTPTGSKNRLSSYTSQKQRHIKNTNKIKGTFNQDLQNSMEKSVQGNHTINVSLNFYEERSKELSFECGTCNKRFSTIKARNFHMKTHLPNHQRKYQCSECGSGFHTPDKLSIHMRIHTKERPFKCGKCSKSYSQVGHLKIHLRTHYGFFPFECNQCDKKFVSNSKLNKHVSIYHTDSKLDLFSVQCITCSLFFKDSIDLKIHHLEHVSEDASQNFFSSCNSLEGVNIDSGVFKHVKSSKKRTEKRVHTMKNLICEVCGMVVKGEAKLLAHQSTHKCNDTYLCSVCGEEFPLKAMLEKHLTSHIEDGVICSICGIFVKMALFTSHMQRHENKNSLNYQCKKCGKQYKLEYSFMRHVMECREEDLNQLLQLKT